MAPPPSGAPPVPADPPFSPDTTGHQALNVYIWGEREQDRVLTQTLGPALRALLAEGALRRLWLHRYDARGPHLMAVLGGSPGRAGEVRARLSTALDAHFASWPSAVAIEPEVLRRRDAECRGRALNPLDAQEGFAANNSYAFAPEDSADTYLFRRAQGLDVAALEPLLADLSLWSVARVAAASPTATAVGWAAGLSRALRAAGRAPEPLWRYYASTLLPRLSGRILAADAEVVAGLPRLIGESNVTVLNAAWNAADAAPAIWPGIEALARLSAPTCGEPDAADVFLRELCHGVFAQLGLRVVVRIPVVLYAWQRTLLHAAAP